MQNYKQTFFELAMAQGNLKFGEFTLKSGRISPYFFNAGLFNTGQALADLGSCYAQALMDASIDYDVLFGPAYKGIPLVSVLATSLALNHDAHEHKTNDQFFLQNHRDECWRILSNQKDFYINVRCRVVVMRWGVLMQIIRFVCS